LLILRMTLGVVMLVQGTLCLQGPSRSPTDWCGLTAIAGGALLTVGFLTPFAALVVALEGAGVALSLLPSCSPNLFDANLAAVFAGVIWLAILLLGPGAFSIDARMFGRREVIIPPPPASRR
jgi:uncharacterized membrane protein YphA (DoxX/SURF4 family)